MRVNLQHNCHNLLHFLARVLSAPWLSTASPSKICKYRYFVLEGEAVLSRMRHIQRISPNSGTKPLEIHSIFTLIALG